MTPSDHDEATIDQTVHWHQCGQCLAFWAHQAPALHICPACGAKAKPPDDWDNECGLHIYAIVPEPEFSAGSLVSFEIRHKYGPLKGNLIYIATGRVVPPIEWYDALGELAAYSRKPTPDNSRVPWNEKEVFVRVESYSFPNSPPTCGYSDLMALSAYRLRLLPG